MDIEINKASWNIVVCNENVTARLQNTRPYLTDSDRFKDRKGSVVRETPPALKIYYLVDFTRESDGALEQTSKKVCLVWLSIYFYESVNLFLSAFNMLTLTNSYLT